MLLMCPAGGPVHHEGMTTVPSFTLRAPRYPEDAEALAAVLTAASPDWPTTAEHLLRWQATRNPELFHTEVLAERGGQILGAGAIGHDDFSFEEWRYWGNLGVHPDDRHQGVGTALFDELLRRVKERGAREVRTMVSGSDRDAPGRAFLDHRGFRVAWERFESELHTASLDLGTFDPLMARVADAGVQLVPLSEVLGWPEGRRWLHELDWQLFQDVPMGTVLTKRSLDQWVKDELEDPALQPELSFVAVRPGQQDPLTGPLVGYSTLGLNPGGFYYIGMTGVLRAERGQGVAKALKVAAMRALDARGGGLIKTFNDAPNVAMLTMNEALGFQRTNTRYRYELHLDGA